MDNPCLMDILFLLYLHSLISMGGRLDKGKKFCMEDKNRHPIIMPKDHYVTRLLVRKFHHQAVHQGRLLTEGALRSGGFWVVGAKNLVRSEIKSCVTCRKLSGSLGWQRMADLPQERRNSESEEVGIDVHMSCHTSSPFGGYRGIVYDFIYQCTTQVHGIERSGCPVAIRPRHQLDWGSS